MPGVGREPGGAGVRAWGRGRNRDGRSGRRGTAGHRGRGGRPDRPGRSVGRWSRALRGASPSLSRSRLPPCQRNPEPSSDSIVRRGRAARMLQRPASPSPAPPSRRAGFDQEPIRAVRSPGGTSIARWIDRGRASDTGRATPGKRVGLSGWSPFLRAAGSGTILTYSWAQGGAPRNRVGARTLM